MFATLAGVSLFAQTVVPSASVFGAGYSQELEDAYNWAYGKSITTMSPIENANMYGAITRAEMAKMLANWAKDKGETPDTSKACNFSDTASVKGDLATAIVEACQLGLMGQGITSFRPYDTISRAEFGTALSRALWGNKYEGGTPYYTNHLNALKAAGIMTQIANAESTKEVRGYVMLMLMRSEGGSEVSEETDCDDPLVVLACNSDSDACPAACKEDSKDEDTKVRSGDLAVTAEAAEGKKVVTTGISDMDTLTFKTSEEVEISKITLERYGYNSDDSDKITGIWLEDENGNIIADAKTLTKDKVTLSIKKDYRKVDGEYVATIVVETKGASKGTIGFKVTDVDSTAKNLNVDNYDPYTYEIIDYVGSAVTLEIKGSAKNYNYEEWESYEIARLKVKATNKDITVKGFTLTNNLKGETEKAIDMKEFLDELTVTVDSKEIKAKASVNKDDELVVSFDDVDVAMNKSALFVLSASFKEFDAYGDAVKYEIAKDSDFNAVEKKNWTRVTLTNNAKPWYKHTFAGGKIKLTNKKLGNVDAAQASQWTIVAEWNITVTESLSKLNFDIDATGDGAQYIETFTMVVNGDEFEATKVDLSKSKTCATYVQNDIVIGDVVQSADGSKYYVAKIAKADCAVAGDWTEYTATNLARYNFKNVDVEKSGKIQFKVDILDNPAAKAKTINFSAFNKSAFDWAKYDSTNKYVAIADVAGSISFSKVTLQEAKASLENKLTKDVEFLQNETNRKVVFDGTYTAKKADIDLNKFAIAWAGIGNGHKVTFYLFVDGEEVADTDVFATSDTDTTKDETFSDVRVEAGKSVNVKVEAEVEAYWTIDAGKTEYKLPSYTLVIRWTDVNWNEDTGKGYDALVSMKIKAKGSVTIPSAKDDNTALLKAQNATVAKFTVKPSNGNEWITLEDLELSLWAGTNATKKVNDVDTAIAAGDLRVKVGGVEYDLEDGKYSVNEEIPTEGLVVEVTVKPEVLGKVVLSVDKVNGKGFGNTYSKYFVPSLVTFVKQDEQSTSTEYELFVEHSDDAYSVKEFKLFKTLADGTCDTDSFKQIDSALSENESFTIMRGSDPVEICKVTYQVYEGTNKVWGVVSIDKATYKDYFKVNGKELAIPKA